MAQKSEYTGSQFTPSHQASVVVGAMDTHSHLSVGLLVGILVGGGVGRGGGAQRGAERSADLAGCDAADQRLLLLALTPAAAVALPPAAGTLAAWSASLPGYFLQAGEYSAGARAACFFSKAAQFAVVGSSSDLPSTAGASRSSPVAHTSAGRLLP